MAAQHGPENIRVNCVAPGMVYTPMVRVRMQGDDALRKARIGQNLMKKEGTGWDVGYGLCPSPEMLIGLLIECLSDSVPLQQRSRMGMYWSCCQT